jgi:predicted acyltransferase
MVCFCSPQVKLYRAVGTGVLTYLILLYLLAAMKSLWLRKRRSTREAAATTNTVQQT